MGLDFGQGDLRAVPIGLGGSLSCSTKLAKVKRKPNGKVDSCSKPFEKARGSIITCLGDFERNRQD
jgi:hypothetical protein